MPALFLFGQIFAADPNRTENVAKNGEILIFAPGDPTKTPLALTTASGLPLANPVKLTDHGFGPEFMAELDQVAWEGGGFSGTFESYRGMKDEVMLNRAASEAAAGSAAVSADEANEAKLAAQEASGGAAEAAVTEVQEQLGTVVAEAEGAKFAAETAAANAAASVTEELAGALADVDAARVAAETAASLVEAPADEVTAVLMGNPATATGRAMGARVLSEASVQVPPLVAAAIAEDQTVVDAAVQATDDAIAAADLVKRTDPGAPVAFTDEEDKYAHSFVTKKVLGRLLGGFLKAGGWWNMPEGFNYADRKVRRVKNDQYLSWSTDRNGRVMEDALDIQGNIPMDTLSRWGARLANSAIAILMWPFVPKVKLTTKTVKLDGTGDFTTIKAAIASITDSSMFNTYKIIIYPGEYFETGIRPTIGVYLEGTNRDTCIIRGELPDNTTDATLAVTSTIDPWDPTSVSNLTITGRNVRYPIHPEAAGKNPDSKLAAVNCTIEHFGNQGMRDWRTANPGSGMLASTVWDSWIAWGEGSASGNEVDIDRTTLRGRSAFYLHGSADHAKPMRHRIRNSRIVSLGTSRGGMTINPIGSGTQDELTIENTQLDVSYISYQDSPWQTRKPENQYADKYEIRMTLVNCTPVGWTTSNQGEALRVTSSSTGPTSAVRVSGTAAPILFGEDGMWKYRDGGGGLAGYAYGYWDISGILVGLNQDTPTINTLGKRLGNCATTPLTLTVTVDGGATINVLFNTDLTAASNATILNSINTALGAAATASEYLVTAGERYPSIPDKELELVNTGSIGIPRWAAVKYGADRRGLEIMGTAEPATAFVGVALAPIPPGKSGRVLTEGRLKYDQLYGYSGGITPNQGISLSGTTAGAFVTGASKQLATGFITDWACFKGNR